MHEQVIEKLRKILRLAGDAAATPGEIEAAMGKARAIAMEHSIDLLQINFADGQGRKAGVGVERNEMAFGTGVHPRYYQYIFRVLKECLGVHTITKGGLRRGCKGFWLVGEANDVAVTREIFPWLEKAFAKAFKAAGFPKQATYYHGFYAGMGAGIVAANKRAEKETLTGKGVSEQQWGLVVRSKEDAIALKMPELFPNMKDAKKSTIRGRDGEASILGFEQGRSIRLGQLN